jgi:Lon protease-like protein
MLPRTLPIFPLPNAVLFPNVFLPLHIFEPRYREMVAEALAGDRLIGMTLLRPGSREGDEGRPPVYQTGCAGLITHADRLPDGRFNIVLRGLARFRITGEETGRSFRVANIEPLADVLSEADRARLSDDRHRLEALLVSVLEGGDARFPVAMPDEDLVNALAQYLPFEPIERQALLEKPDALARCRSLIDLLEMRAITASRPWGSSATH